MDLVSDTGAVFTLSPEYRLFTPNVSVQILPNGTVRLQNPLEAKLYNSVFGDKMDAELARYAHTEKIDSGVRLKIDLREFGADASHPFKMRILADGEKLCKETEPFITLGMSQIIANEYGWMIPPMP